MTMERYQSLAPDLEKVGADSMQQACAAHRRFEVEKEKQDLDVMKKAGTQVNEVKDLKAFQALMKPVYAGVEQWARSSWTGSPPRRRPRNRSRAPRIDMVMGDGVS